MALELLLQTAVVEASAIHLVLHALLFITCLLMLLMVRDEGQPLQWNELHFQSSQLFDNSIHFKAKTRCGRVPCHIKNPTLPHIKINFCISL